MARLKTFGRDANVVKPILRGHRQQPLILACFVMASLLASKSLMVVWQLDMDPSQSHTRTRSVIGIFAPNTQSSFAITFSASQQRPATPVVYSPKQLRRRSRSANYNGLLFARLTTADKFRRQIHQHDDHHYAKERSELLHDMRHGERSVYYHDEEQDRPRACERTNWKSSVYMNCNECHTLDMREDEAYEKRFLGCVPCDMQTTGRMAIVAILTHCSRTLVEAATIGTLGSWGRSTLTRSRLS